MALAACTTPARAAAASPQPADCSLVNASEAAALLGYDVLPASPSARASGECAYASETISQDGGVSYALTDVARLEAMRPYFAARARMCGSVAAASPNAASCAMFRKIARAADVSAYYAARTDLPDAVPIAGLGERASSASGTLFVRRGATIFEAVVRRDGAFDLERSKKLVRLLLERTPH